MAKDDADKNVAPDEELRVVEDDEEKQQPAPEADDTDTEPEAPKESADEHEPVIVHHAQQPIWKRAWNWAVAHRKVSIPAAVVLVLAALAAIPFTRYALAGTVLKQQFSVTVVDKETKQPVSSAEVALAGKKAMTDARGRATVKVPVGNATLSVSKKYYKDTSQSVLVPIMKQKHAAQVSLEATGRQVALTVVNKITKQAVAGATITALDTEAKTDKQGKAVVVVPADKQSVDITVKAHGYNDVKQPVQVNAQAVNAANVELTPAGKVYFLSNKSGKIDVVKSNLDGSERVVVLAGTGKEDRGQTNLVATRDWRYLALYAKRDSDKPKLYLIDTSNDKLTVMDEGDAEFGAVGWSGHSFIYTVTRTKVKNWEPKRQALKSYNATTQKITTLDETTAEGNQYSYVSEGFNNVFILDNEVVYVKGWDSNWNLYLSKQRSLISVRPDTKAKKTIKSYNYSENGNYIEFGVRYYKAQELYILYAKDQEQQSDVVEEYSDGQVKKVSNVTRSDFYEASYPTYLISPSGERAFWTDVRDGKNAFFIGDKRGESEKHIGAFDDYTAYGWYGEEYLLAGKKGSELYILPAGNIDSKGLLKVTDYYRPVRSYYGYGY